MTISWFLTVRHQSAVLDQAGIARVSSLLQTVPELLGAVVLTPGNASDPYLDDGRPPILALQLDFAAIEALERAVALGGALHGLIDTVTGFAPGTTFEEQAMLARVFPVPDPTFRTAAGALPCTYLVAYEGGADDLNAWLSYYIAHHPPIMARFPNIRAISIFTRIDWCSALPAARGDAFQRNKVVFDDDAALHAALNSPVRHEMRADFQNFPPFRGRNTHYAMHTRTIVQSAALTPNHAYLSGRSPHPAGRHCSTRYSPARCRHRCRRCGGLQAVRRLECAPAAGSGLTRQPARTETGALQSEERACLMPTKITDTQPNRSDPSGDAPAQRNDPRTRPLTTDRPGKEKRGVAL